MHKPAADGGDRTPIKRGQTSHKQTDSVKVGHQCEEEEGKGKWSNLLSWGKKKVREREVLYTEGSAPLNDVCSSNQQCASSLYLAMISAECAADKFELTFLKNVVIKFD